MARASCPCVPRASRPRHEGGCISIIWIYVPALAGSCFGFASDYDIRIPDLIVALFYGSYGMNINLGNEWKAYDPRRFACKPLSPDTPVLLDCASHAVWPGSGYDDPPAYEGQLITPTAMSYLCIDRHQGGINSLFWSGAVRKVGLKELWTLKWHPAYDTANCWTKAGGVQPEDWPEWMRGFKDY